MLPKFTTPTQVGVSVLNQDLNTNLLDHFENNLIDSVSGNGATANGISFTQNALAGNYSAVINYGSAYAYWHLGYANNPGTVEISFRLSALTSGGSIILQDNDGSGWPNLTFYLNDNGTVHVWEFNGTSCDLQGKTICQVGSTYNILYTWGSAGEYLYINNSLEATIPWPMNLRSYSQNMGIGRFGVSSGWCLCLGRI